MKMSKKVLSVLLAVLLLAMTVAVAAVPASALDATGSCGTNLTYTFNSSTGALTITGTGSTIRSSAFKNCTEIKSVSIGSSVTSIGQEAFFYCTNLERVSLPSNLRTIDYMAFYHCEKLEDILIPASVTAIGKRAFCGCALKKVMIPSGVTSLDSFVFEACLNLETVIIDTTLTTINDYAFNSCLALKDVYYKGSERDWNNGVSIGRYNEYLKSATMHYNTASNVKLVQITLSASPASYGTVSGGGIYMTGESVTIKATPNSGYVFDGWYYRDNKISTNATYTFAAAADGALTADFRKARTCTVSVSASPSAGGTVTGGGTYTEGQTATVKATWNIPYTFEGWYNGSTLVSTKATYSFTVTGSVSLTAKYKKPTTFTITVVAEPAEGGTVTGGGFVNGTGSTIVATPNEGWHFVGWFKDGSKVSDNASYAVSVADDKKTFTAKFERDTTPDNPGQPDNPGDPGTTPAQPESVCPWCGGQHVGFFQGIIGWFHSIFSKIFGARY